MSRADLTFRAYESVRSAIISGQIASAAHVSQRHLSSVLGISRTPTREALRRLELEGFVERQPSGRFVAHSLSPVKLQEIFFVRELLQGYASRLAAVRISDEELRTLEELGVLDLERLKRGDVDGLVEINDRLHGVIVKASRNRTLAELLADLDARIYGMKFFAVGDKGDQKAFVEDHLALVRHLRNGDADKALELAREHVRRGLTLLLSAIDT